MVKGSPMEEHAIVERLETLRDEHRLLDETIDNIIEIGDVDNLRIRRLKKRKLQLKDEIIRLESLLYPDIIA